MTQLALRFSGLLGVGLLLGLPLAADAQDKKSELKTEPSSQFTPAPNTADAVKLINEMIAAKWKDDKGATLYQPAEKCSDHEFIRRASLDIIGRIAKVEEIKKFMSDPPSTRRAQLVERLLASEEYARNWSTLWTFWLMTRTGDKVYKDQIELWLEEEIFASTIEVDGVKKANETSIKDLAIKLITAKGKTNDKGEVNYILAHLGGELGLTGDRRQRPNPQQLAEIREKEGMFDMVPVTSRTVRLFLGYQIQCTQCHDHPFNADWKQKHFWGVNAFFRQVEREGTIQMVKKKGMPSGPLTLKDNDELNKKGVVYYEKRNGVFLPSEPIFLDGSKLPKESSTMSRREILAKFLTGHKNFSKSYVNRMWGHFFSRGMNEKPAADDFGEHNPVIHDELLDKLGEMFVAANYNPKTLIRWVVLSDPYQLKAMANKTNDKPDDEVYFSRQMLKAMGPEELYDSLLTATQPGQKRNDEATRGRRQTWLGRLTQNFGDDEGNELTFNGTVVQALLMMNGRDLNDALNSPGGTLEKAKALKGKDAIDYLYLATLNRPCSAKEYSQITAAAALKGGAKDDPAAMLSDVFWALLNCNEFILNH
jgi:hypothetical protein